MILCVYESNALWDWLSMCLSMHLYGELFQFA